MGLCRGGRPLARGARGCPLDRWRAQPWITASSGPLEEFVRSGVLLLMGRDISTAASIGLGWAATEVVYSLGDGLAVLALLWRDDPEAVQARALLPIPAALEPSISPCVSVAAGLAGRAFRG